MDGRLVARCPKCGTKCELRKSCYMRGDRGVAAKCTKKKCSIRFEAQLTDEDIKELYGEDHYVIPIVNGEEYELKSTRIIKY